VLPHVIDLFNQAERTPDRSQGGLGIGLALVKTMVALHGGTISAWSAGAGSGSTFALTLPTVAAPHGREADAYEANQADAARVSVMIVDDNVDAGESLATLLEAHGHNVTVKAHPREAIAAAREQAQQVFILDIGLPDMDGYELARQLRDAPGGRDALFIALTGYGQAHDRVLSKTVGFDYHFVKPMDVERLRQILARAGANPA
jgi:CheY-like chemotaxis protein